MKNKTILGSWCTEPNCKFIDSKHIQIELMAHIWYSYDNDSKTDVINKKLCFIKEIEFNELNGTVEIIEEEKKIPEKITINDNGTLGFPNGEWTARNMDKAFAIKFNQLIDYLESKGE